MFTVTTPVTPFLRGLTIKSITLIIITICWSNPAFSQKESKPVDKDALILQAKQELNAMMANPESSLRKSATKHQIKGEYIFDITLKAKGRVLSVFVVSSDADEITQQNMVKDWVAALDLEVDIPKNITCKFQYSFNF